MIRHFTQLHENERLISIVQTPGGRIALWFATTLLLLWLEVSLLMILSLALVMLFPDQRRLWLSVAAVGMVIGVLIEKQSLELGPGIPTLEAMATLSLSRLLPGAALIVAAILFAITVALHFEKLPAFIKRFPLIALHTMLWLLLVLSTIPGFALLASASGVVWRLNYLLTQASRGKIAGTRIRDHLFYLVPVYGISTPTPMGKGLDYLSRHESKDSISFARSQLAGIKLLLLAALWIGAQVLLESWVYGDQSAIVFTLTNGWTLGLPGLNELISGEQLVSIPFAWLSIYLELIRVTLGIAIVGHIIVGCLRLLGFNVFRNTYKPLLCETIIDFWNRLYFYFKELLVEFFFYPTYFRSKWAKPKTRLFLAVFAAAFFGNMYYHILESPETVLSLDIIGFWAQWGPRWFYCFLLALGIWISMLRQQASRAKPRKRSLLVQLRRIAGVWTFYAVIRIWNVDSPETGILERFQYFLSMFGI